MGEGRPPDRRAEGAVGASPAGGEGTGPGGADVAAELERLEETGAPAAGPAANAVVAVLVVALGAAVTTSAVGLGVGTPSSPGAGTFPLLLGLALVALGIVLAVLAPRTTDAERFTAGSGLVLLGVATMVAFTALVRVVGFEVPAVLLALVWLRLIGRESWRTSVVLSLVIGLVFYAVFVGALSVPIPHLF